MSEPLELVTGKTDAEKAAAYRAEVEPLLAKACDIMNRARQDGMIVGWGQFGIDQFGRTIAPRVDVNKPL